MTVYVTEFESFGARCVFRKTGDRERIESRRDACKLLAEIICRGFSKGCDPCPKLRLKCRVVTLDLDARGLKSRNERGKIRRVLSRRC